MSATIQDTTPDLRRLDRHWRTARVLSSHHPLT